MARFNATIALVVAGLASAGAIAGCNTRPTYPKAHLAESLQALLTKEQLNASVRQLDHTLAVQIIHPDTLVHDGLQIAFGPAFDDVARHALTNIHRVVLSSDATIDFYVLLLSDPNTPGAYLTLVRYMDDVRRANANMIPDLEMYYRTLLDVNLAGPAPVTLEAYVPRDIRLEEFLSWQLARRIQRKLIEEFQLEGRASVGRCGGAFNNGEFVFTLNIAPLGEEPFDEATMRRVFESSTGVVADVLSDYRFKAFETIRLTHPLTGRNIILPRARLDVFR